MQCSAAGKKIRFFTITPSVTHMCCIWDALLRWLWAGAERDLYTGMRNIHRQWGLLYSARAFSWPAQPSSGWRGVRSGIYFAIPTPGSNHLTDEGKGNTRTGGRTGSRTQDPLYFGDRFEKGRLVDLCTSRPACVGCARYGWMAWQI